MIKSFIQSSFVENERKRGYYITYSLFFCVIAFFCFSWFLFLGKSLIWQGDGWCQHFKALVYYAKYLRGIIRHLLFDHQLIIPDWDFCIGEGSDIVNALHFYVIGDPIALLSVFVPTRYMPYFFSAACILRLYLAGLSFSALCFGTNQKNRYGILAGSIAYSFCMWALLCAARHPYFLNPMIYFPLMILGIEKILRKEKPYLFIIVTAISAVSNFYFFYMIVILTVVYAIIRLGFLYRKQVAPASLALLRIGAMAVIGVCIAGVILLPILMMFLSDSRFSVSQPFHLFYPMSYYSQLPAIASANSTAYWLCMGYAAPVILSIFLLFIKKKEDTFLKVLFGVGLIIILFPICGRILNGMSYMTNRWSWAFALLCTYILVKKWDELISLSKREWILLTILCIAYYGICLLFDKSRDASTFAAIPMFFIALILVREIKGENENAYAVLRQLALIGLVAVCTINLAFWEFSPGAGNYVSEHKEYRKVWEEWKDNESVVVQSISGSPYTRISGRSLKKNANIFCGISSTQYYWSISNPYMNNFRSALSMREETFYNFQGYDDRTTPTALSAVQYYSVKNDDSKGMPYGYTLVEKTNADPSEKTRIVELKEELGVEALSDEQIEKIKSATENHYSIYKNDYALPIVYCYDSYFTKDMWDSYNPVQKQEAQLDAAYVNAELGEISLASLQPPDYYVPYDVECQGIEISKGDSKFITTADNAKIVLTLHEDISDAETYVGFTGLEFTPTAEYDLYFGKESVDPLNLYNKTNWDMLPRNSQIPIRKSKLFWNKIKDADISIESNAGTEKTIEYKQPDSSFSSGRHDFIANLGYVEDSVSTITIAFSERGIYSFDSLDVYGIPMNGFADKIAKLQADTLQDINFGTDSITGEIALSKNKMLCFATPFSKGWEATIDGQATKVYCVNERYPGIVVPVGKHIIQFHYHTPYKKTGFCISMMGLAVFGVVIFFARKKKRKGAAA